MIEGPHGLLLVRRPEDDESLPGVWGLPAASLAGSESEEDAVRRAGREELGVEVVPVRPVGSDGTMTDWESTLFIDAGAVADRVGDLSPLVGVGAGVRWRSPVGPLQADLAYGVKTKEVRLHLRLGFSF